MNLAREVNLMWLVNLSFCHVPYSVLEICGLLAFSNENLNRVSRAH